MATADPAALASAVVSGIHDAGRRAVLQGGPAMLDGDDVLSVGQSTIGSCSPEPRR